MPDLSGRLALVTGAAGGIGAAVASALVAAGAGVVLADLREDDGRALAKELGPDATFRRLDVTDESAWQATAGWLRQDCGGRLDILVTCAGIALSTPLLELSAAQLRAVLDVNVVGTLLGIRATAPLISAGGGGSIVTVSSVNGFVAPTGLTAYAASKWAIRGLTRSAAVELAPFGIRVNAVCPGSIETAITDTGGFGGTDWEGYRRLIPLGRRGTGDDVAGAVLYLVGDGSGYVTGAELVVDGGLIAGRPVPRREPLDSGPNG